MTFFGQPRMTIRSKKLGDRLENKNLGGILLDFFFNFETLNRFPGFEGPLNIMIYPIKFVIN